MTGWPHDFRSANYAWGRRSRCRLAPVTPAPLTALPGPLAQRCAQGHQRGHATEDPAEICAIRHQGCRDVAHGEGFWKAPRADQRRRRRPGQ